MAENAKERIVRYLEDAHAVEMGSISSMKDIVAEATDPQVKSLMEEHLTVTQTQADRVEARMNTLGGKANGGKSLINKIIGKGSDLANALHGHEDKQTQDVIKSYALENFEVGMYTSLHAFANAVGDYETAQLAQTLIEEERMTAERILRVIPQVAMIAAGKTDASTVSS